MLVCTVLLYEVPRRPRSTVQARPFTLVPRVQFFNDNDETEILLQPKLSNIGLISTREVKQGIDFLQEESLFSVKYTELILIRVVDLPFSIREKLSPSKKQSHPA